MDTTLSILTTLRVPFLFILGYMYYAYRQVDEKTRELESIREQPCDDVFMERPDKLTRSYSFRFAPFIRRHYVRQLEILKKIDSRMEKKIEAGAPAYGFL